MTVTEIEGKEVIFHCKPSPDDFGLTKDTAWGQDLAEEYAVVKIEGIYCAGIMVYGKYNGEWKANPWSARFLIRVLLDKINVLPLKPI